MNMWPQYLVLALWMIGIGLHLAKHGEPMDQKYNFFGRLFGVALLFFIFYKGGFFNGL